MPDQEQQNQLHDFISQRKQAGVKNYDIISELVLRCCSESPNIKTISTYFKDNNT